MKKMFKLWLIAVVAVVGSIAIVTNAQQSQDPFSNFVHPDDGDTIRAGSRIRVVAVSMFEDPPADGRLQFSENSGVTWSDLDYSIHGRAIFADYVNEGVDVFGVVKFRTYSESTPWFNAQISVFVE